MTNPSHRDIETAHASLRELHRLSKTAPMLFIRDFNFDKQNELLDDVLKVLPPIPKLTMAEVEWDEDEHYLAEAEHPDYGLVIMLSEGNEPGVIHAMCCEDKVDRVLQVSAECLTLTGRRFVLKDLRQWGA